MEIADYIPNYPELNDPDFNNKIYHKKEFYDLRTTSQVGPKGKPGDLWPHQKLLARFVSPYTSYNEVLLFHTPGTGKTCGASAIVEMNKQDPQVRKPVLIVVPNKDLATQWKQQIALVCTDGEYIPENYFTQNPLDSLTDAEKTGRLNKLLAPVYYITTLGTLHGEIDKLSDTILKKRYSNTLIIIDEAHNLRIQTGKSKKTNKESQGQYKAYHRLLHLVENSKILLLSGTPMYDRVGELPGLMNLILPLDQQLPTGAAFTKKFLKKASPESGIRKIKNVKELYGYLLGRVSYIREGGNFPRRVDLGQAEWTEFLKTVNVEMSELQLEGYNLAYGKDVEKGAIVGKGVWKNSRQAAVFVYQHGNKYVWGDEASDLLTTKGKQKEVFIKGRKVTYTPTQLKVSYHKNLKENMAEYSAKYAEIIDYIGKHPGEPTFIFTPLVHGAGGAIFLGLVFGLFGYARAVGNEKYPGKRYALITGEEKSSIQRKALIEMFNSPANANGEFIQVMIATKTIAEGTSFTNVMQVIVLSPYWNNSGTEQAISRGLRANSLADRPPDERVVTVQELAITSDDLPVDENIDAHLYKMSEAKDFNIKVAERVLKKVAWDCPFNYDRNVRVTDTDNSRSCDYQKCNYVCYQTTPEKVEPKWQYDLPEDELDESTYLLYYSKPELLQVVEKIKELLRVHSYIDVEGLNQGLDVNSFKLLILAIEYIIENHVTVYNKWGQTCFLRKEGNMLFLSDTPTEKNILGSWYARYPYANDRIPLTEIINNDFLAQDLPLMDGLDVEDPVSAQIAISNMNLETRIFTLETLLKMDPEEMTDKQSTLYNAFMDLFKSHIFTVEDTIFHDLEKTKMDIDYIDFTKGEGGSLRCLRDGAWTNCEKKEGEEFAKIIKQVKESSTEDIIKNPHGIYGIITTDGKFKLADPTKEKQDKKGAKSSDLRKKYTGKNCVNWVKWQLAELFLRLKIESPVPLDDSIKSKAALLKAIKELKGEEAIPKNATIAMLQKIYTLMSKSVKVNTLCEKLHEWFEANNLIIYE